MNEPVNIADAIAELAAEVELHDHPAGCEACWLRQDLMDLLRSGEVYARRNPAGELRFFAVDPIAGGH